MKLTHHALKILPEYYDAVLRRTKTFEVRRNDRAFKMDELLTLREFNRVTQDYTGREATFRIGFVLELSTFYPGTDMVVLSLLEIEQ